MGLIGQVSEQGGVVVGRLDQYSSRVAASPLRGSQQLKGGLGLRTHSRELVLVNGLGGIIAVAHNVVHFLL